MPVRLLPDVSRAYFEPHLADFEPGGVEDQAVEPGQQGRQGLGGGAGDAPGVPVEGEVELQVLEVVLPRGHVPGRRTVGSERLPLGETRKGRQDEEQEDEKTGRSGAMGCHGASVVMTPAELPVIGELPCFAWLLAGLAPLSSRSPRPARH